MEKEKEAPPQHYHHQQHHQTEKEQEEVLQWLLSAVHHCLTCGVPYGTVKRVFVSVSQRYGLQDQHHHTMVQFLGKTSAAMLQWKSLGYDGL